MERGPLKIYPRALPLEFTGAHPWHWIYWVKRALDPLLAVGIYLGLLWFNGESVVSTDVAVIVVTLFLLVPADIRFRVFNWSVAFNVLRTWARVTFGVGALWVAGALFRIGLDWQETVTAQWLLLTPAAMLLLHAATPWLVPSGYKLYPRRKVVIVGVGPLAVRLADWIDSQDSEGQHFMGYFDDRDPSRLAGFGPCRVIGRLADVTDYVKRRAIDAIYISLPMASQPRVVSLLDELADTTASIYFLPDIFVSDPIQARLMTVAGLPVVSVRETPFNGPEGAIKRVFDLALTIGTIPVWGPLALFIAILVVTTSRGPVLFTQRRYGLDGKPIVVMKFRTMSTLEDGEGTYTQVTRDDCRVTRVGRFLRATSLDELPQLLNVLAGSMSLVGPRPHALAINEQYRKLIPGYMLRHKVKPGISGWAQVNGCRGGDDLESMRRRTEYDLAYLRSWSLSLDILIVAKTLKILALGDKAAY